MVIVTHGTGPYFNFVRCRHVAIKIFPYFKFRILGMLELEVCHIGTLTRMRKIDSWSIVTAQFV